MNSSSINDIKAFTRETGNEKTTCVYYFHILENVIVAWISAK